jgi:hypothetical protein
MADPMKVYVSGAIAGRPDGNKDAFFSECEWLLRLRHHDYPSGKDIRFAPVNPHMIEAWAHEGECPEGYSVGNGHSSCCWLRADLRELLQCDAMLMLEGWYGSKGAALERDVAKMCGIPIFENRAHFLAYWNITEMEEIKAETQLEMDKELDGYDKEAYWNKLAKEPKGFA